MISKRFFLMEMKSQIRAYDYYLNTCPLDNYLESVRQSILGDPFLMKLYGEKDPEKLYVKYVFRINELRKVLADEDREQYICNVLEYMRFMVSIDQFKPLKDVIYFENLFDSTISVSEIGRGTNRAQAAFMLDLLPEGCASLSCVGLYDKRTGFEVMSHVDVVEIDNKYLIPGMYDGVPREYSFNAYEYGNKLNAYIPNNNKLMHARKVVADYLIKLLNLQEISSSVEEDRIYDRINFYKGFINGITVSDADTMKDDVVLMSGYPIEASKLFELFLMLDDIPYEIMSSHSKENTIYLIYINGIKEPIDIHNIIRKKDKQYVKTNNHDIME